MRALWFFIRLFIILAISLSIAGLQGSVLVYAYGYEIHIRLWVTLVFMVLFVLAVWYILRGLGWIHAGVAYITRTRKLYKQLAAIPHIAAGRAYATVKSSVLKPFGKKHPLYQITSYQVNTAYDIHIPTVLSSPYAAQFIQVCISHSDTGQLSAIRAFYTTHTQVTMPPLWYLYESTVADTLQQALLHLSYVRDNTLKNETVYYTVLAHIKHCTTEACDSVQQAWKSAQTEAEKWRLCTACLHIKLSDVSDIVPFENVIYKKDGTGMLLLAILSVKLQLWGPADVYIGKSIPYAPADKVDFVKAFVQYMQNGNSTAYIEALHRQNRQQTGMIL